MKKILTAALVLTMIFAMSVPVFAAKGNGNQDFEGEYVTVTASAESVFVGEDAKIVINVENIADRGIPKVSIWVDGEQGEFYENIDKGATEEYVIDVDTSVAGVQAFNIEVWSRKDNKNFAAELYAGVTSIEVLPVVKTITVDDIRNALNDKMTENGVNRVADLVEKGEAKNTTKIELVINGEPYVFVGANGTNSDKICDIDGVIFVIVIQGNDQSKVSAIIGKEIHERGGIAKNNYNILFPTIEIFYNSAIERYACVDYNKR